MRDKHKAYCSEDWLDCTDELVSWIVHNIAENPDGVVLTERTDRFEINGQWMDILVMGVMEFKDGLICNWRDYFDMKAYEAETAKVLG